MNRVEIIPAVDLMDGGVVRLRRGEPDAVSRYDHMGDPVEVAGSWQRQGAQMLHVIDLDAAFGRGDNVETALEIARTLEIHVQFGGGVRDAGKASSLLEAGIHRVILGSLAVKQPGQVYDLVERYGSDRAAVALDYRDGVVVYRGWAEGTELELGDALRGHLAGGVRVFLVTSAEKDGTLEGPDTECLREMAGVEGARILAAGGIGSINDIVSLREAGVEAAVVGRALYEERFTLAEALEVA